MPALIRQKTLVFSDDQVANASSSASILSRSLTEYGACWGTLKFEDALSDHSSDARPFLYIDGNIDLNLLHQFMVTEWKLTPASIVIPVLSGVTNHKPFKKSKMVETLRNGIKNTANASEVWFITNGIDAGLPQLIGAAFREDIALRRSDDAWVQEVGRELKERKPLILIGIVCDDEIKDVIHHITANNKSKTDVNVYTSKRDKYSLNSDHTHFIIIREQPIGTSSANSVEKELLTVESGEQQLEKLIDSAKSATNRFRNRFEDFLHREVVQQLTPPTSPTTDSQNTSLRQTAKINPSKEVSSAMVCTFVRGTPGTIEMLYQKLQQEVPAVILKGTGSAADIIAFAFEEISTKNTKNYEDDNLKVELARRLLDEYPALRDNNIKRNEIRDQIIAIVKKADQSKQKYLTFVDVNSTTVSLNDFHKSILSAYLQSKRTIIDNKINVQLQRNLLRLTLDWNLPDVAQSEIFQRDDYATYTIPNVLFEQALLSEKLEAFVDLFLERDFVLHRYLNSDKLISLFNEAKDRDFLTITSLEGILGLTGDDDTMPANFVQRGLNNIVKRLTGIKCFFSKNEMNCNAMGIYFGQTTDKDIHWQQMRAEKKALRHLIIYAVLMNRCQLAKILWKRSSEPIPLALLCSMMFKNLAPYCYESYQRLLIKNQAKEFSDCAVGVLDKSFKEDDMRTFEILDKKHPDWNHMTIVELAYNADNKEFMAHAVCQKWVTRQLYGEITPRELSWGLFKCPTYLKIISSACLIFPMWFWISFSPIGQALCQPSTGNDFQGEKPRDHARQVTIREGRSCFQRLTSRYRRCRRDQRKSASATRDTDKKPMNCIGKIKTLWSAPITKFYINFVAYLVYLFFFTLAVLWPSCGNLLLDCFVWFWTATIACENTRVAYGKYCSQSTLPLQPVIVEVLAQVIFLALYLGVRIIGLWSFGTCQILTAKAILGIGLIYYYYRILFIFLPISPILGPMMIRLRYMIMGDFFTFLRLFLIFMISSGAAITAVLYPHHPLDLELFSKAFVFRGFMVLFSSQMADFRQQNQECKINATSVSERKYACLRLSHGLSSKYDNLYAYNHYGISSPKCSQTSWIAWFLLIQYFLLAKRFLISLLTAMFGLTGARVQRQSEQIWLYNRYAILKEYVKRPRLPPPFVVISYIIELISNCYRQCALKLKAYSDYRNDLRRARTLAGAGLGGGMARASLSLVAVADPMGASSNLNLNDSSSTANEDRSFLGRLLNSKLCRKITRNATAKNENVQKNWEDSEANIYWKYKAKEYFAKAQETDKAKDKSDNPSNSATNVQKDIDVLRKSLQQINDRVATLEKMMIDSHMLLEKICARMPQEVKEFPESHQFIHIQSRESPYVYTNEARFPVTAKFILWEIPFDLYDPTLITLPKEHICFRDDERSLVEPNLLKLTFTKDRSASTTNPFVNPTTPIGQPSSFGAIETPVPTTATSDFSFPVSEYKWNQIVELQLPHGKKMIVDRTTWVTRPNSKTPIIYRLDTQLLISLNPIGRTGVRGRGALIRWGPNKSIMAIITRWKKHRDEFVVVEGHRILEAVVFKDKMTNDWKLPGGKLLGVESPYSTVCRSFNELAFQDEDSEPSFFFQERDMIEHFESFARSSDDADRPTGFESHMVYRGYIDDVRNTDNAWVEAEIWNFHYGSTMSIPHLHTDGMALWKNLTHNSHGVFVQASILREIARIHDAYFE